MANAAESSRYQQSKQGALGLCLSKTSAHYYILELLAFCDAQRSAPGTESKVPKRTHPDIHRVGRQLGAHATTYSDFGYIEDFMSVGNEII